MKQYPYSYENHPDCWPDLDCETKAVLCNWIKENLWIRKTPNLSHSSYGLKHFFQRDTGRYVFNGQFKAAMLLYGFEPVDDEKQNCHYRISKRSPALDFKHNQGKPRHPYVPTVFKKEIN